MIRCCLVCKIKVAIIMTWWRLRKFESANEIFKVKEWTCRKCLWKYDFLNIWNDKIQLFFTVHLIMSSWNPSSLHQFIWGSISILTFFKIWDCLLTEVLATWFVHKVYGIWNWNKNKKKKLEFVESNTRCQPV